MEIKYGKKLTLKMYDVEGMDYFKNKLYYNIGYIVETNMDNEEKLIMMKCTNDYNDFTISKEKKLITDGGYNDYNSLYN